jgi:rhodanese-related sulfurtransferase
MDAARAAGKEIVLYCTNTECPDARVVAGWLAERGYSTLVYRGGWEEWKQAGLPVE